MLECYAQCYPNRGKFPEAQKEKGNFPSKFISSQGRQGIVGNALGIWNFKSGQLEYCENYVD